jgi:hypothetical protein
MMYIHNTIPVHAEANNLARLRSSKVMNIWLLIRPQRRMQELKRRDFDVYIDTSGEFAGAADDTYGVGTRTRRIRRTRCTLFLLRFILGLVIAF